MSRVGSGASDRDEAAWRAYQEALTGQAYAQSWGNDAGRAAFLAGRESMRRELGPWLRHKDDCAKWVVGRRGAVFADENACTCGLAEALR